MKGAPADSRDKWHTPRVCETCSKELNNEPAILIDDVCYCFFHAKRAYYDALNALRPIAQKREQKLAQWHEEELRRRDRQEYATPSKPCLYFLFCIYLIAVVTCFREINGNVGVLSIFVLGYFFLWVAQAIQQHRLKQFDECYPPKILRDPNSEFRVMPAVQVARHPTNDDPQRFNIGYNRAEIIARDANRCQCCGFYFQNEDVEVHHVNPFANQGTDSWRNLTTLCVKCHIQENWFGHFHKKRRAGSESGL